jgi:DNA polymerase II large subunit
VASRKDEILAQVALERGLLNEQQLNECRRAQMVLPADPNVTIGRGQIKPLGTVLLERSLVSPQQLTELVEEQNRRLAQVEMYDRMVNAEMSFGQLLVKHNKATQNQINKCLEIQRREAEKGRKIPILAQILIDHGYVDAKTVSEVLKMHQKDSLLCTNCGKQFNVIGLEPGKTYKCKSCGGIMVTRTMLDTLKADETSFSFELPTDESPK